MKFTDVPAAIIESAVYLGVDQSLAKTGLAFEDAQGRVTPCLMSPPDLKGVARLVWFREQFHRLATLPHLRMAALEGYAMGAKFQREALGELGGVLKMAFHDAGCPTVTAQPTQVKKFLSSGKVTKEQIIREVWRVWSIDVADNNEADAVVLSQIARSFDLRPIEAPHRREVIAAVAVLVPKRTPVARVRTRTR